MCGRAAVIRAGAGLARAVGAHRIVHDHRSSNPAFAAKGAAGVDVAAGSVAPRPDVAAVHAAAPADDAAADSAVKKEEKPTGVKREDEPQQTSSDEKQAPKQTQTQTQRASYFNANCGPTSTVPVWRLQTAAEQTELLQLEHSLDGADKSKSVVKREIEELAADAIAAESEAKQTQSVPIIQYMQWGFHNPVPGGNPTVFNARSETVDEKVMFRQLVEKKRCIVCVDGFYEWHTELSPKTGDVARKQGYFFHIQSSDKRQPIVNLKKGGGNGDSPFPPLLMAALYDAAINDATGELQYNCVVLTCGPSAEMRKIHTRMPVILSPEDARKWVDVDRFDWKSVKELIKPYEGLGMYKVPPIVNSSRNHGIECLEPLEEYEKRQKAAGIQKFFSPKKPSAPASSVQANTAVTNSDGTEGFFNTKGAPGSAYPSPAAPTRINPADPGQTEGHMEPATEQPATATSDVAKAAEAFVQQVKGEEGAGDVTTAAADGSSSALAGSKRSHAEQPNDQYDLDPETMAFEPEEDVAQPAHKKSKQQA